VRRVAVLVVLAAACAVVASPASATNECKGLKVCVPIAGPWVLAMPGQVQYQLSCPKRFIIGGLDAELSSRGIDVGFVGGLGSPVNPGITTSQSVIFLGRLLHGRDPAPTFRPHIGCIPAAGGGQRVPTAYHAFPPGKPSTRELKQIAVRSGVHGATAACAKGERLVAATHAIGFRVTVPPTAALAHAVAVSQRISGGRVHLTIRAGPSTHAVVQVDLVCGVLP